MYEGNSLSNESMVKDEITTKQEDTIIQNCDKCNEVFENHSNLQDHMKNAHDLSGIKVEINKTEDEAKSQIEGKVFECNKCNEYKTADKSTFIDHYKQCLLHSKNKFKCDICGKSFQILQKLTNHFKFVHNKNPDIKCDICSTTFYFKSHFVIHNGVVHQLGTYTCEICKKFFAKEINLKFHTLKIHKTKDVKFSFTEYKNNDSTFKCTICDKEFPVKSLLENHEKSKHEYRYKCQFCEISFSRKDYVTEHTLRVHEESKAPTEKCSICDKEFSGHMAFKFHLKTHREKRIACDTCGNKFTDNQGLKNHVQAVHEKLKLFGCNFCKKKYSQSGSLHIHMKKAHGGKRDKKCPHCGEMFFKDLRRHIESVHLAPKQCQNCKKFVKLRRFQKHVKNCVDQDKVVIHEMTKLRKSKRLSGRKAKDFTKKTKILSKKKKLLKQISCDICNQTFKAPNHLKLHYRSHNTSNKSNLEIEKTTKESDNVEHIEPVQDMGDTNKDDTNHNDTEVNALKVVDEIPKNHKSGSKEKASKTCYICSICKIDETFIAKSEDKVQDHLEIFHKFSREMQNIWFSKKLPLISLKNICENCEDDQIGMAFCFDCNLHLCQTCHQYHQKMKVMKDHSVEFTNKIVLFGLNKS